MWNAISLVQDLNYDDNHYTTGTITVELALKVDIPFNN